MTRLDSCPCSGVHLPRFVQPVLLALLVQEPMHGYALRQKMLATGLFAADCPDMTGIYRNLRDMVERGVLTITRVDGESGPARNVYAVTDTGLECLRRWQQSLKTARSHIGAVLELLDRGTDSRAAEAGPGTPDRTGMVRDGTGAPARPADGQQDCSEPECSELERPEPDRLQGRAPDQARDSGCCCRESVPGRSLQDPREQSR